MTDERRDLRTAIEELPIHSISGYEWECGNCDYDWKQGIEVDSTGRPCDHRDLIDRSTVLELLEHKEGDNDPSDCPKCGEWRDSPRADCANCGHIPAAPCGDPSNRCLFLGPHDGPHKVAIR